MSFMNPVDMVEEDAADLQFPKGRQQFIFYIQCNKRLLSNMKNKTNYIISSFLGSTFKIALNPCS